MKKLLSLTAAALLLITTGCGRSNAPSASASSAAPSVSAPITEPTVESSDDTAPTVQKDEAAKPQNSGRMDDSRIIPLYSERFTYTDPYDIEDTYFYEVPQIDDDTEDAKHINAIIDYRYGYLVERALDARSRNDFVDTSYIIWVSNWNGPVLSLQVTSSDRMFNRDVGSYHYNFATGQELTNLDLLEYMGYTDSAKTLNALQRATAQYFDLHYGGNDPTYAAMLNQMRVQSLSELDNVFTYYSLYPYYTGGLVVTVPMYTPAGSGMYWTDVQIDPNKRQASGQILHGQDEWFTCDVTATGEVTVRALTDYVTPDGAVTYQTMKEWYELGDKTEFAVSGCYSDYIKLYMGSVGQDYAPYVFLLTEEGVVEYIDVLAGARSGEMVNGGPLYGVNGIIRFESGTAYDTEYQSEYTTVYGITRSGERTDLMQAVAGIRPLNISPLLGSFASEQTGTWFSIAEDAPNFYTGVYQNGTLQPAVWDGSIEYCGMDSRGWICRISQYRMDIGRAESETVALMPDDYVGVNVKHLGGESILNLPEDEFVWFEMNNP